MILYVFLFLNGFIQFYARVPSNSFGGFVGQKALTSVGSLVEGKKHGCSQPGMLGVGDPR